MLDDPSVTSVELLDGGLLLQEAGSGTFLFLPLDIVLNKFCIHFRGEQCDITDARSQRLEVYHIILLPSHSQGLICH